MPEKHNAAGKTEYYGSQKRRPHTVMLDERKTMSVTGVLDVPGFDENAVALKLDDATLVVKGENLHLSKLSLETGDVAIDGVILSLQYLSAPEKKSMKSRLFR